MKEITSLRHSTNSKSGHLFTHKETLYCVLGEYELDDKCYAIMEKQNDLSEDLYLFQIKQKEALDIEDESEWDRIVEEIDALYS